MKIVSIEAFAIAAEPIDEKPYWGAAAWGKQASTQHVSAEYPPKVRRTFIYSQKIETVIVKVVTNDGTVGWGEAKAPVASHVTKAIIDSLLTPLLLGVDPRETTLNWERMYAGMRVRGHQAGFYLEAISGVDIALWDIVGKSAGLPLYTCLGGPFRNPVRIYASGIPTLSILASDDAFDQLAKDACDLKRQGYTGIKMALGRDIPGDIRSTIIVRDAVGPDVALYADAAGSYDVAQAVEIGKRLEELDFGFFEMPIAPENKDGYAVIASKLSIPLALDSLMTRYETIDFLRRGAIQLVQPDVCRAGGITECRRIADLADAFGVAFAPHVSIGSAISFAASAHLAAAAPNTMTCEYWIGENPLGNCVLREPLRVEDGRLYAPDKPGLGLEIIEDKLLAETI